jgi:hypothetical protein
MFIVNFIEAVLKDVTIFICNPLCLQSTAHMVHIYWQQSCEENINSLTACTAPSGAHIVLRTFLQLNCCRSSSLNLIRYLIWWSLYISSYFCDKVSLFLIHLKNKVIHLWFYYFFRMCSQPLEHWWDWSVGWQTGPEYLWLQLNLWKSFKK